MYVFLTLSCFGTSNFVHLFVLQVTLKCKCGRREQTVQCSEGRAIVQSVNSAISSSKDTVDLQKLLRPGTTNLRYNFKNRFFPNRGLQSDHVSV